MGRTDAWSLQLPEPLPVMPEVANNVETPVAGVSVQLGDVLSRPAPVKSAIANCPSCKSRLSGVELKLEKCLSCGKSFAASSGAISVSVGL